MRPHLFDYFERSVICYPHQTALICNELSYTYQELNLKVEQFSHYLLNQKIKAGEYVCVLLERSHFNYICLLALCKIGAVYVPIDPKYPEQRIEYILNDLNAKFLITEKTFSSNLDTTHRLWIEHIDGAYEPVAIQKESHQDCYVIYTSGTTGNPKGVAISHENICHYIASASQVYHINHHDKIYQGFSLSFDASMEEVWMAFAHGATLVACTSDDIRSGVGLTDFLNQHQMTVLSTVPSLLSIIDHHIPSLRLILLGGETCHPQQILPWFAPHRRIINTYGPTEASVVTTFADIYPEQAITIGKPLPGYEVFILNEQRTIVPAGVTGELCIGGPALSKGYINLPELTKEKFIPHPFKENQTIYRSGDLARLNHQQDLEFSGRLDEQIKLRGFRIELNEIESKLCQFPGVIRAAVQLISEPTPTLVAFYELKENSAEVQQNELIQFLQKNLPYFMIPHHLERLLKFPLLPSGKINKKALPQPTIQNNHQKAIIPPKNAQEQLITQIWSEVFHTAISTDNNFFLDLGGHSLFAAQVISKLRQHPGFEHLSIKDLYQNPTVALLAVQFVPPDTDKKPQSQEKKSSRYIPSNFSYYFTSIGQFFGALLSFSIHSWPVLMLLIFLKKTVSHPEIAYLSCILLTLLYPLLGAVLMIGLKWTLIGKVKPGKYPLWGFYHFRIWLFHCIEKNFAYLLYFYGTPFINQYFRCMGAKIGKDVLINSVSHIHFGLLYDLVEIGDYSSIGMDSQICTQYIKNGYIHLGPIQIGKHCYVGNRALLKPNTIMHDHSYLDEMGCLKEYDTIQSHEFFSGSPAKACPYSMDITRIKNFVPVPKKSSVFFLSYCLIIANSLIKAFGFIVPFTGILWCYQKFSLLMTLAIFVPSISLMSIIAYYGLLKIALSNTYKKISKGIYSIDSLRYFRYWWDVHLLMSPQIGVLSDSLFAQYVFRFLGLKVGSRCEIGGFYLSALDLIELEECAFVATNPSLAWPITYHGYIHFEPLLLKKNAFIGNLSYIRSNEIIGQESLIGVTSLSPDNHQAQKNNTAWVGIPPIFLPKRQEFNDFSAIFTTKPTRSLIWQRILIETCRIFLPTQILNTSILLIYLCFNQLYSTTSTLKILLAMPILELLITIGAVSGIVILKWLLMGKIKPTIKPLWSRYIWKYDIIEYLFSFFINPFFSLFFKDTIFHNLFLRFMGCKIGKKAYIGTLLISEFDLIHIGDHSSVDEATLLQCHLYEDRIYKTSYLNIGNGCDVGISASILYDTQMGNHSSLGDKSLLMKGESLPANTHWQGSPASIISNTKTHPRDIEEYGYEEN